MVNTHMAYEVQRLSEIRYALKLIHYGNIGKRGGWEEMSIKKRGTMEKFSCFLLTKRENGAIMKEKGTNVLFSFALEFA